jgi:holo-[acyl-carrier protein] synthase
MIYGIGTDLVNIRRVQAVLARHGDRFARRVLGPEELIIFYDRFSSVSLRGIRFIATRFAAKEAFSKAIGLGMRLPMTWRAMQIINASTGKPEVAVTGLLKDHMDSHGLRAQVSISDESDYALAFVVVEKSE